MTQNTQVSDIIKQVEITDKTSYTVNGKEHFSYHQKPYFSTTISPYQFGKNEGHADIEQQNHLVENLTNMIYSNFYCKIETASKDKPPMNVELSDPDFVETLSKANTSTDGYDYNWRVYALDGGGIPWGSKNGVIKQLQAGTYINTNAANKGVAAVNEVVHVSRKKESRDSQPAFYFSNSNNPLPQDVRYTRFYFNITPEGAPVLLSHLTSTLNYYKIPFSFKCLNSPKQYIRTDSAVLYLDKKNTPLAYVLLGSFVDHLKPYLKEGLPLFAKKLWKGIAFAEDPGNGDSFGMNRSRLIAQGLLNSFLNDDNENQKQKTVIDHIEKSGFDLEQFHLNPHSHFEYNFA